MKEDSILHKMKWHRVILDEAHNIKDRASNTAKAAFGLKAKFRWCLSGECSSGHARGAEADDARRTQVLLFKTESENSTRLFASSVSSLTPTTSASSAIASRCTGSATRVPAQ